MPVDHSPKGAVDGQKKNEEEDPELSNPEDDSENEQHDDDGEEEEEEEEDQLSLLIYKRGQIKAKVTRARNTLRTDRGMNLPRVQVMQKNLHTFYDEYTRCHNEILDSVNKKGRKAQEIKYIEFEDLYTSTLEAVQALEIELSTQIPSPSTSRSGTERVIIHQQALKAPLPTFDGRYENWAKFKSMFLDLMKRSHDSDAIKLYHLEKSLVGAAAGVIDIKTINDNNYTRAWQILENRFENKRNIIDTHIRELSNLKKMSKESYTELRALIEECTRHVDHLEFMEQKLEGVSQLMVVNQLADALDPETRKLWEATLEYGQLPTYKETIDFLKKRCQILERCQPATASAASPAQPEAKPSEKSTQSAIKSVTKSHAATTSDGFSCHLCNKTHPTFRCDEFRALSIAERNKRVKDANVCYNCLRKGHRLADCPSTKNCMVCKARHNTLLHPDSSSKNSAEESDHPNPETKISDTSNETQQKVAPPSSAANTSSEVASCSCSIPTQVLLMTAVVHVLDKNKKAHPCRAFIDPGSMSHMVSEKLAKLLDLPSTPACTTISGINGIKSAADRKVSIEFQSRTSDFRANISCLVLKRITGSLPVTSIDTAKWGIPPRFDLADPQFNVPDEIDLLVGCGMFWQLLEPGTLNIGEDLPELRNSKLGWIVTGEYRANPDPAETIVVHSNAAVVSAPLNHHVQKLRNLEEVPARSPHIIGEEFGEQHVLQTHSRDESGKNIVSLPCNDATNELGDSPGIATKRFLMQEKRLTRSPQNQDLPHCQTRESNDPPDIHKTATFNIHTSDNPADIESRGQLAEALRVNDLWWHGPEHLREKNYQTPHLNELPDADSPEQRNIVHAAPIFKEVLPVFTPSSIIRVVQLAESIAQQVTSDGVTCSKANPSTDPNDPVGLTAGHLMNYRELPAIPEPSSETISSNRLSRWQYIQHLQQPFWRRWPLEFLNQLQGTTPRTAPAASQHRRGLRILSVQLLRPGECSPSHGENCRNQNHPTKFPDCYDAPAKPATAAQKSPPTCWSHCAVKLLGVLLGHKL